MFQKLKAEVDDLQRELLTNPRPPKNNLVQNQLKLFNKSKLSLSKSLLLKRLFKNQFISKSNRNTNPTKLLKSKLLQNKFIPNKLNRNSLRLKNVRSKRKRNCDESFLRKRIKSMKNQSRNWNRRKKSRNNKSWLILQNYFHRLSNQVSFLRFQNKVSLMTCEINTKRCSIKNQRKGLEILILMKK